MINEETENPDKGFLFSIIVPCYNQGQYLDKSLKSIQEQSYSNWECIIVNDGSSDSTELIAETYCKQDKRFKYFFQKHSGVGAARNHGLRNSIGRYIKFLDADDWMQTDLLEKCYPANDVELVLCRAKFSFFNSEGLQPYHCDVLNIDFQFENLLLNWGDEFDIPIHCGLISSNLLKNYAFDEHLKIWEDWFMWLFISKQNPSVLKVIDAYVIYRKWKQGVTTNQERTILDQFIAYQNAISIYSLNNSIARHLNEKVFKKLFQEKKTLEGELSHFKKSTSFKISHFLVSKTKFCLDLFKKKSI
ncbi:MAG: glycosyltransferase family 2 protein [Pedobacter sp.]|nr:MAG: glycosyltransferase family 2 protein [Pedobacter sp.]